MIAVAVRQVSGTGNQLYLYFGIVLVVIILVALFLRFKGRRNRD